MDELNTQAPPPAPPTASPGPAVKTPVYKPKKRMADEPHWITILIGIASPALAAAALYISLSSLHTSERSLEVGQRAYVTLQNGRLTFDQNTLTGAPRPSVPLANSGSQPNQPPADDPMQKGMFISVHLTVTVVNTGNTPAQFVRFTPTFRFVPEGWTPRKQEYVREEITPAYLGAKSEEFWQYSQYFKLTPQALADFSQTGIRRRLRLAGELVYKDVFDKEHTINWCWDTFADKFNNGEFTECVDLVKVNQGQ